MSRRGVLDFWKFCLNGFEWKFLLVFLSENHTKDTSESTGEIPICSVSFWQVVLEISIFENFCLNGFGSEKIKVLRFGWNSQGLFFGIYNNDCNLFGDFWTSIWEVMRLGRILLEWIFGGKLFFVEISTKESLCMCSLDWNQ